MQFDDKSAARGYVWGRLQEEGAARFPYPPHGRIPNFAGAEAAARRLFELEPWAGARRMKVNPDAPQLPVRLLALERGVELVLPTPRLRGGFRRLDPARIPADKRREAVSVSKSDRWAEPLEPEAIGELDAVVVGSVAVDRSGRRCGKGEGYADLELAVLYELGHAPVPIATTVHPLQVVDALPWEATDLPLAAIVTPDEAHVVTDPPPGPAGIEWERLGEEDLDAMPLLRRLRG